MLFLHVTHYFNRSSNEGGVVYLVIGYWVLSIVYLDQLKGACQSHILFTIKRWMEEQADGWMDGCKIWYEGLSAIKIQVQPKVFLYVDRLFVQFLVLKHKIKHF